MFEFSPVSAWLLQEVPILSVTCFPVYGHFADRAGGHPSGGETSHMVFSSFSWHVCSPMVHSRVTVAHCSPAAFFLLMTFFQAESEAPLRGPLSFIMGKIVHQFCRSGSVGLARRQTRLFPCRRLAILDSWSMFHAPSLG